MRFEAGTPNIADAIGLGAAIDYLSSIGMENVRNHEIALTNYALTQLNQLEEITLYGTNDMSIRGGVISFQIAGVHPHDIGTILDQHGVAIRAGHHCAIPLVRQRLMVPATARASFYIYNTIPEVDKLVEGLNETLRYFGNESRRTR
jgi:cysteine desulfurase/selenocysteine lyase